MIDFFKVSQLLTIRCVDWSTSHGGKLLNVRPLLSHLFYLLNRICLYLNAFINLFMPDHLVLRQRETINDEKLNLVVPPNCDVAPPSSCRITDGKLLDGDLDPVPPGEGAHPLPLFCPPAWRIPFFPRCLHLSVGLGVDRMGHFGGTLQPLQ
jgi:hypothetical protein